VLLEVHVPPVLRPGPWYNAATNTGSMRRVNSGGLPGPALHPARGQPRAAAIPGDPSHI